MITTSVPVINTGIKLLSCVTVINTGMMLLSVVCKGVRL